MNESLRTLPVRVAPLPGEALDSWLEALARRLHTPLGEVTRNIGLPPRLRAGNRLRGIPPDWTILLQPQQAAALSATTGLNEARIHAMTLRHYDQRAVRIDTERRRVRLTVLWGRGSGSRFCPDCLAENGGRWMLSWRLGWAFACLRHMRLLADCCPRCGRVPRHRPRSLRSVPDSGRCGNAPSGPDRPFTSGCGFDLKQTDTLQLPARHPALTAQARLMGIIETGTATFGSYALAPQPSTLALADIRAISGRVLSTASGTDLTRLAPADIAEAHLKPSAGCTLADRASERPGFMAPPRAVSAATAVTAALQILDTPDIHQAGKAMGVLLETIREEGDSPVSPASLRNWGRGLSPVLTAVHLAALAPSSRPSEHLRHRMPAPVPRLPTATTRDIAYRSRKIPSMFWSSWTVRLAPQGGVIARILAPALAACLLIVDSRLELETATGNLGNVINGVDVSRVLQRLDNQPCWPDIVTALIRLADHLDATEVPIDYGRRRGLDYTRLLPAERWRTFCRRTGTPHGTGRRERIIRCHLFHRISGLPIEAAPGYPRTNNDAEFRAEYARATALHTPMLAEALHAEAQAFLVERQIHDEPVTWQPPTTLLAGLTLPGPDPDQVDVSLLHRLVRQSRHPVQHAAEVLGTSVETVRYLLEEHPAPMPQPTDATARTPGQIISKALQVLPKDTMARLYLGERRSLDEISQRTGFSRQVLRRLMDEYDIPVRNGPRARRHAPVERAWLLEQYVHRCRTLADLAREKGMSPANMTRWAQLHDIPLRRRGGASHGITLRVAEEAAHAPAVLRAAFTSTFAGKRLQRFSAALPYPTIREAAQSLGINPQVLVAQIIRLERDLGQPLIERAERGRRMRPTPFGRRIAAAARQLAPERDPR
ncbi:MAG: TniQ family protein [Streptomycetaceae bacterium]|nr:TniQ family protein [Streptomycetaceae bacterium]